MAADSDSAGTSGLITFHINGPGQPPKNGNKATRVSLQKVRTGCITCKKRHVKCDEAKPHCNNCLRMSGRCEGYATATKREKAAAVPRGAQICWDSREKKGGRSSSAPSSAATAISSPRSSVAWSVASSSAASSPRMAREPCPTAISFGDATCAVYFDEFVSLVCSPWISAACHGDWWKIMLPQLARSNIYLYHAAISVGALSKWHQRAAHTDAAPRPLLPAPGSAAEMESDPHYLRAIAHYCQALRLQRKGASTTDALFLSILLVCFETLRGNNKTALAHVNHGLALLLSVVSDVGPGERMGAALAPNPRPVLGAVADIFVNLAGQARSVLPGRLAEGAPFPNFTKGLRKKKQTIESFMITLSELPHCSVTVDNVPEVFTSLDQFEQYWLALGRKQVNVSAVLMEVVRSSGMLSVNATDDLNNFYQNLLGNQRITEICEELTALMLTLGNAFTPLFNSIIMTEGVHSPLYFRALYLRLQFIASYLFQNPSFYLRVEYLQAQTPYFREYLTMAQLALRAVRREIKHPAQQLSLQCLMSSHLLLVAFFCREPLAREEALNLLEDYPVQDGVWNVRSLYQLGVRNRDVERRNTLEGSPTAQWERLRRREYLFEEGGTRVIFRFMDNVDDLGAWELVEEAGELSEDQKHMRWTRQPLTGSGRLLMVDLVNV